MASNFHTYEVEIFGAKHYFQFADDEEAKAVYPNAKRSRGNDLAVSEPVGDTVPRVDEEAEAKAAAKREQEAKDKAAAEAKAKAEAEAQAKAKAPAANKARGAAANKGS